MPIPDFQTVMRPLLEHLSDGAEHSSEDTLDALAAKFQLSDEDRAQLLPSGKQKVFPNRVAWAKSHLKQAGLIESTRPGWGVYRIAPRGMMVLKETTGPINIKILSQFPEYQKFRPTTKASETATAAIPQEPPANDEMTPEEHIEYGSKQIRQTLSAEILERIKKCSPSFFEELVVDLIVAMGYGGSRSDAGQAVGKAGDGGIDGVVKEDPLGLDVIYLQAKRWENVVGRPEVQKFAGALQGQKAKKGILLTTSSFTKEARDFASFIDSKIVLIDGSQLTGLLIDHGVGVAPGEKYEIKKIDSDYFEGE
jgi:restriction system protein